MPRPTVNAVLLDILHGMPGESFTVAEVTAVYRQHPATRHPAHKAAWQFVQRNLQRLIKLGTLESSPDRDGALRWVNLSAKSSSAPASLESTSPEADSESSAGNPYDACRPPGLVARLEQHKSDMLCALGEVEEYKVLSTQFPALRKDIQSRYVQALERSNLLLGKIKAVESLLPVQHDARA